MSIAHNHLNNQMMRRVALAVALTAIIAACESGDDDMPSAAPTVSDAVEPAVASTPEATASTAVVTETTAPCETNCPVADEDRAVIEAMIDAYNSGDSAAWLATLVDDQPVFATPVGEQSTALVEYDFIWSSAMNEIWALGDCVEVRSEIACDVTIEDDLHRGLADLGLVASECRIIAAVVDGLVHWKRYDLDPCHTDYDQAMHAYGEWFVAHFPDEDPIDGFHYRGWNQIDTTAGERAQAHLGEYLASGDATLGSPDH